MNKTRTVRTSQFDVRTGSGRTHSIIEESTQVMTTFLDGTNTGWMEASKRYVVAGGGFANKVSETEFRIVASDEIATRV